MKPQIAQISQINEEAGTWGAADIFIDFPGRILRRPSPSSLASVICEICVICGLFQIFAFPPGKGKVTSCLRYRKKNSHGGHGGHGVFWEWIDRPGDVVLPSGSYEVMAIR